MMMTIRHRELRERNEYLESENKRLEDDARNLVGSLARLVLKVKDTHTKDAWLASKAITIGNSIGQSDKLLDDLSTGLKDLNRVFRSIS